jgi:hypothetical protein
MKIFNDNPVKYISEFSEAFEDDFLVELGEGDDWLVANELYSAMLRSVDSVRLTSTKWPSLAEFLEHIETEGMIEKRPDPNRPGFLVRRLDPHKEERIIKAELEQKRKLEKEQKREEKEIEKRTKLTEAFVGDKDRNYSEATAFARTDPSKKITISLGVGISKSVKPKLFSTQDSGSEINESDEEDRKELVPQSLLVDCIVKIKSDGLKVRVLSGSTDNDGLHVELVKTGERRTGVDRSEVETVIPNIQKKVKVVRGGDLLAGLEGILMSVDPEKGTANVFFGGLNDTRDIPFDDISKSAIE